MGVPCQPACATMGTPCSMRSPNARRAVSMVRFMGLTRMRPTSSGLGILGRRLALRSAHSWRPSSVSSGSWRL